MKKLPILLLAFIFSLAFVFALPMITDISNYPDGYTTSNSSILFNYNISDTNNEGISQIKWSWDDANYSIFDSSLVLFMNFDNRSALGENDLKIVDLSKYSQNGTIGGYPNVSWISTGKYNGGFNFIGSPISSHKISVPDSTSLDVSSMTFSVWVKLNAITDNQCVASHYTDAGTSGWYLFLRSATDQGFRFNVYNTTSLSANLVETGTATDFVINQWYNLIVSYDFTNGNTSIYLDGVLKDNHLFPDSNLSAVKEVRFGQVGGDKYLNGSIDDVLWFNKSLISSEIFQLYKSQLTKHDSQNYTFQTNQSLNANINSTSLTYDWDYYLCSSNSTGSENCTTQKTITQTIPVKTLTTNFTSLIGTIRSDFYGVNTHGIWGNNMSRIVTTESVLSDYEWHREKLLDAGIKIMRADMALYDTSLSEGVFDTTTTATNYKNINARKNLVEWAKENNVKIDFIAYGMPEWLANKTSGYCSLTGENITCPPSNYTKFGELVVDFLQAVDCDSTTCEVSVWNEPHLAQFWLNNLSEENTTRYSEYNKLVNATYLAVKEYNSSISVIAGSIKQTTAYRKNFVNYLLDNATFDGFIIHPYVDTSYIQDNVMNTYLDELLGNCTLYNANCSKISIGEWNVGDDTLKNTTARENEYGANIGLGYLTILNKIPSNASVKLYQWSEIRYYNDTANYLEYPDRWSMVSEPQLDNAYYPPYNVTKNFATRHRAGDTVYSSYSDDDCLKVVSSHSPDGSYDITIINTCTVSKNDSLLINPISNLTGKVIGSITNYLTGQNYVINNNETNLGIKDSYNIEYLTYSPTSFRLVEGDRFYQYDSFLNNLEPNRNDVWFNQSTSTEKHIASNLTESINATITFNVASCDISSISYTPKNETSYSPTYSCSSGIVTINNLKINPSSESNILNIVYMSELCVSMDDTFDIMIVFLGLIILVSMTMFVVRIVQGHPFDDFLQKLFYILLISIIPLVLGLIILEAMFVGC